MNEKSYIFDELYFLNIKFGADYQRQKSYILHDIEQNYELWIKEGLIFLYKLK